MMRVLIAAALLHPFALAWAQSSGASAEEKKGCYEMKLLVKECWQNHWENVFEHNALSGGLYLGIEQEESWAGDIDSFGAFASNTQEKIELSISKIERSLLELEKHKPRATVSVKVLSRSFIDHSGRDPEWTEFTPTLNYRNSISDEYNTWRVSEPTQNKVFHEIEIRQLKTGEIIVKLAVVDSTDSSPQFSKTIGYAVLTRVVDDEKNRLFPCRLDLKKFSLPDSAKTRKALSKI